MACQFPHYELRRTDASETAGGGGVGGSGPLAVGGVASQSGLTGSAPGGGTDQLACVVEAPTTFGSSCYDGVRAGRETDVDCGGECQGCFAGSCLVPSDCVSGICDAQSLCAPALTLLYRPENVEPATHVLGFRLLARNDSQLELPLHDLKLRYYFKRNGVAEAIAVRNTQSVVHAGATNQDIAPGTVREIIRLQPGASDYYDAYVQVSFTWDITLFPSDSVEVAQQVLVGNTARHCSKEPWS